MATRTNEDILRDPEFLELTRQKAVISTWLTVIELTVYFGFILLVAFGQNILATKVTERVPLGIPLAVGTIVLSWVLTGVYIRWANNSYDPMVKRVKDSMGG